MDNITIGQYIPGDSWIYKLDPRMKIVLTILSMILIFIIPNLLYMVIALGLFLVMFFTTKIPFLKMLKGLKTILFLLVFTFFLQIIYNKEGTLLATIHFQIGMYHIFIFIGLLVFYFLTKKIIPFKTTYFLLIILLAFVAQNQFRFDNFVFTDYKLMIYQGGVEKAGFVLLRVILMIGLTSLLTFTTMSTEINNGLSAVLSPLKVIKVPVGVISMMLSLTLRFIPTLLDETNKIMKAQASRGVDFSEGKLHDKVLQIISLLIPMFVISFKRAEDLANAMEARGYVIDAPRTKLDLLKLKGVDYCALFVTILLFAVVITLNFVKI